MTIWSRSTRKPNTRLAFPETTRATHFIGPRRRALPMPPLAPNREFGILEPAAKRLGLHPIQPSHGAQQRALQRPRPLHALPVVLRICLRSGCEKRLAEHGDPGRACYRELRAAHRMHGEGDSDRRPGTCARRRLLRREGPLAGAALGHRRGLRVRHRVSAAAAEFKKPAVSRWPGKSLRSGGPQSARPPLHRRDGLLRL